MSKKKKYDFSEAYVRKHRSFPVGNTILLVILVILQLALVASIVFWHPSPQDTIKQYNVTVEPLDDGSLDITYSFVWEAQDASEPLTWVTIGMANPHYTVYSDSVSSAIEKHTHIENDDYVALELHFYGEYYDGQTAVFSFKINQQQMLCQDINGYFYEFIPCWFNEIPVEQYTFRWKQGKTDLCAQPAENGYYEWHGSFECGEYQAMSVRYTADAFSDVKTVDYTPFDDSGTYNDLQNTKVGAAVAAIVFIVLILVAEVVIVDSYVSYGRGRGFLSGYGHPIHVYGRSNPRYNNAYHAHHPTHSSGFSGGCACACACACAGGGRAGCSQKDTFGNNPSPHPYIICHMVTSLDGKVTGDFLSSPACEAATEQYYHIHRHTRSNGFICGRVTMEESFTNGWYPDLSAYEPVLHDHGFKTDFILNKDLMSGFYAIAFDPHGRLGWRSNRITDDDAGYNGAQIIEVLTEQVDERYLGYLESLGIPYIFAGETEIEVAFALFKLKTIIGADILLLEGGSILNGAFAREDCIDELSLVIAPIVGDQTGKSLFTDAVGAHYTLIETDDQNGIVRLRYKRREVSKVTVYHMKTAP